MNHDRMHLYRRFLLLFTTFAILLTTLTGPAALTIVSQEPSADQLRRVRNAIVAVGIEPGSAVGVPGTGPGDLYGSIQNEDLTAATQVIVGIYGTQAEMQAVELWKFVLGKEGNLSLGTEWAHVETWSATYDRSSGSGPLPYTASGQASVGFLCGNVIVWVAVERHSSQVIADIDQNEAAGKTLAEQEAKPAAVAFAQRLVAALSDQKACQSAPQTARPGEVYSIPKGLATYFYESPLPALQFITPPTFGELYSQRKGEVEVIFAYDDRQGKEQSVSFRKSMADLIPTGAQQAEEWADAGRMFLRSMDTLHVGYQELDKLGEIVRKRENANPKLEQGETWEDNVLWGTELTFGWHVRVYDSSKRLVAASSPDANSRLRYTVRYPVVFVPGTGGSRLAFNKQGQTEEFWPAPEKYGWTTAEAAAYWSRAALDGNRQGETVVANGVFRWYLVCSWKSHAGCIYELWFQHMIANGYPEDERFFPFSYDWRLGTEGAAKSLESTVNWALNRNYNRRAKRYDGPLPAYTPQPEDKVILISHSLGGLVARDYCSDPERAKKVQALIQLGTPNQGTPKAVKAAWTTGYAFEARWLSPSVAKWAARNWTGAYEQFPVTADGKLDNFLLDEQGKAIHDTRTVLLNTETSAMCDGYRQLADQAAPCQTSKLSPTALDYALSLRALIPAKVTVPTYIIASQDQQTILGYQRAKRQVSVFKGALPGSLHVGDFVPRDQLAGKIPWADEIIVQDSYPIVDATEARWLLEVPYYRELWGPCGDNLVPLKRLVTLEGAEPIFVNGVGHGGYTESDVVQPMIDRLLQGIKSAGETKSTCDSAPRPVTNGVQIQASSPANVHVYDSEGRHTGLTADGWEATIPGSVFEQRGYTQQVVLPLSSSVVRVVMEGTRDTALDVQIIAGDGQNERSAAWLGLAETPKMRAEIQFVPAELGAGTVLKLDAAGDGTAVQSLAPSVTSGGEAGLVGPKARPTAAQPTAVQPTVAPTRVPQATAVPGTGGGPSTMPRSVAIWGGLGLSALSLVMLVAALIQLIRRRKRGGSLLVIAVLALLSLCLCSIAGRMLVPDTPGVSTPRATAVPTLSGGEAISGSWQAAGEEISGATESGDGLYLYPSIYADVTFSAEVRADDREASLAFRMQDAQAGYLAVLLPQRVPGMDAGLYLIKRVGANEYILASSGEGIPEPGEWATLSVEVKGNRIHISLNGKRLIDKVDAGDPVYPGGKLGLRIYGLADAPCHAAFRNVRAQ